MAEFEVSAYMVKQARSLHKTHGILADFTPSGMGKRLSQETCDKVISFYESDEVSQMCPGQKEFVSVKIGGHKVQKQQRLLLLNLSEMYEQFYIKEPDYKLGISKFCELRPRWCVTVRAKSTHSVYVCVPFIKMLS